MSSYPDDRYDDGRDRPDGPRADGRTIERARAAVRVPATLLIITGALVMIGAVLSFVRLPAMAAEMDNAIAEVDADPNMPADQKDFLKKVFTSMKEYAENPATPYGIALSGVFGLLIIVGGVKLLNLSGPTFPVVGSILAMIPCTSSCCCLLGLPAGIWALVALNSPDVRAAIAANRSGAAVNPDDQYMR
jgi:hypothetical protein